MTDTISEQVQLARDAPAAAALAAGRDPETVLGPETELEANMPLLTKLQQQLHSKHAQQIFMDHELMAEVTHICKFSCGLGILHRILQLGDGVVYKTLIRQVYARGVTVTHGEYRVIPTAEQNTAQAAAAAEAKALRSATKMKTAAEKGLRF